MAQKKQLVLVVEGTAAMGRHWRTIVSDYLQIIIRKFCGDEAMEAVCSIVELALVQFNAHGSYSSCLVQRSGWARNAAYFLDWLSCMHFSGGGGFCDAATAEGLAEVLMTYPPPNGTQTLPTEFLQRHCILVAATNPSPLPTPVYRPPIRLRCSQKVVYLMLKQLLNHFRSLVFLCQLYAQSSFRNLRQSTMREKGTLQQTLLLLIL